MPRYALTVEYDGTPFCGWQAQLEAPSVQQAMEEACFAFCGERTTLFSAGRTDRGVHALAQVAHFDLTQPKDPWEIQEALNAHLRDGGQPISVLKAKQVPDTFHARFSATRRHYIYKVFNRHAPSVLRQHRVWHVRKPLDGAAMRQAAAFLIGTHDWTTFRAAGCQAPSPIKTLDDLSVEQLGEEIWFKARARSFLHHQVRSLVGALVAVGSGKLTPAQVKEILEATDRKRCPPIAPASGLYLAKIDYEQEKK